MRLLETTAIPVTKSSSIPDFIFILTEVIRERMFFHPLCVKPPRSLTERLTLQVVAGGGESLHSARNMIGWLQNCSDHFYKTANRQLKKEKKNNTKNMAGAAGAAVKPTS